MRPGVVLSFCLIACAACGDDAAVAPDAGAPPRLEIMTPPGDSIGLAPGDGVLLRVRLLTAEGVPIAGAPIAWKIQGGDRGAGGATLGVVTGTTGDDGISENPLTAGPARVDFTVTVDSGDAPEAIFYISVSAAGFANIRVMPVHGGARTDVARIELRAYRGDLGCDTLDPDALPASPLAPRSVPSFGMAAEWPGLPAGEPYTILAWAVHPVSQKAIAFGCAPVIAAQVTPGDLAMTLAVNDRPLAIGAAAVSSSLDLAPAVAAETAAGIDRPWRVLACPVGAGQVLLDWLVDAIAQDGALDGVTANPTGPAAAITAARGALGADGCRAATKAGGGPSLDAAMDDAIGKGAFPTGAARAALVMGRLDLLVPMPVLSALSPAGPARFHHQLISAKVGATTIDLVASTRPVIAADAAWTCDAAPQVLHLGAHAFTARIGSALGAGFAAGPLTTAGLAAQAAALGQAMVASAHSGAATGCTAVDDVVCSAAGLAAGCTTAACAPAAAGLDGAMTAWWRALDGNGGGDAIDLTLIGTANVADADGDLVIDDIGGGLWSATLATAGVGTIATTGTWTTAASVTH